MKMLMSGNEKHVRPISASCPSLSPSFAARSRFALHDLGLRHAVGHAVHPGHQEAKLALIGFRRQAFAQ